MVNRIDDETIEYIGLLAKLELTGEEKEQAKKDMGRMLDYIDKLNELDTRDVEPMSHIFPVQNVFREDVLTNGDGMEEKHSMEGKHFMEERHSREDILKNAPGVKDGMFKVPRTVDG